MTLIDGHSKKKKEVTAYSNKRRHRFRKFNDVDHVLRVKLHPVYLQINKCEHIEGFKA